MENRYTEKLARYLYALLIIATAAILCHYFRNILAYILASALVCVLARPMCEAICRIAPKGHRCPRWVGAIISLAVIMTVAIGIITTVLPIVGYVLSDISAANLNSIGRSLTSPLSRLNIWIMSAFPRVGLGFRIESVLINQLYDFISPNKFTSVVGSVTSFLAEFGVAAFSICFISFFFIKDPGLITRIVQALVKDKYEKKVEDSMLNIRKLMPRYFAGMFIEVLGVSLLNFLGLLFIARMGFDYSLSIAMLTGILNIIPYLGPLIGGILGVTLSIIIKYACYTSFGIQVSFLAFILILAGIFLFTQLIDNYVFQPVIYSNSVKVHPLEIFIVFLIAGHIGGVFGMLIAIPAYTVLREVARQFFGDVKFIHRLTSREG